jgi:hypothetical protein
MLLVCPLRKFLALPRCHFVHHSIRTTWFAYSLPVVWSGISTNHIISHDCAALITLYLICRPSAPLAPLGFWNPQKSAGQWSTPTLNRALSKPSSGPWVVRVPFISTSIVLQTSTIHKLYLGSLFLLYSFYPNQGFGLATIGRVVYIVGSVAVDIYAAPTDVQSSSAGVLTSVIFSSPFASPSSSLAYFSLVTLVPGTTKIIVSVGIFTSNPSSSSNAQKIVFDTATLSYSTSTFLGASVSVGGTFYHIKACIGNTAVFFARHMVTTTGLKQYDLEIYSIASGVWMQSTPSGIGYGTPAMINAFSFNSRFVFTDTQNKFYTFDFSSNVWKPLVSGSARNWSTSPGWAMGNNVAVNENIILSQGDSPVSNNDRLVDIFDINTLVLTTQDVAQFSTGSPYPESYAGGTGQMVIPYGSKFILGNWYIYDYFAGKQTVVPTYDIITQSYATYSAYSIPTSSFVSGTGSTAQFVSFVPIKSVVVAIKMRLDQSSVSISAFGCKSGWYSATVGTVPCDLCLSPQTSNLELGSTACVGDICWGGLIGCPTSSSNSSFSIWSIIFYLILFLIALAIAKCLAPRLRALCPSAPQTNGDLQLADTPAAAATTQLAAVVAAKLPPGWHERKTAEGRIFYANDETKTTQWEFPKVGMSIFAKFRFCFFGVRWSQLEFYISRLRPHRLGVSGMHAAKQRQSNSV